MGIHCVSSPTDFMIPSVKNLPVSSQTSASRQVELYQGCELWGSCTASVWCCVTNIAELWAHSQILSPLCFCLPPLSTWGDQQLGKSHNNYCPPRSHPPANSNSAHSQLINIVNSHVLPSSLRLYLFLFSLICTVSMLLLPFLMSYQFVSHWVTHCWHMPHLL